MRARQNELFYGYKSHVSLNAQTGLIISRIHTPANACDGYQLPALLEKDLALGLPVDTVTRDCGYNDSANHILLAVKGIHSAILLQPMRTRKKDPLSCGGIQPLVPTFSIPLDIRL